MNRSRFGALTAFVLTLVMAAPALAGERGDLAAKAAVRTRLPIPYPQLPAPFPKVNKGSATWDRCEEHSGCYDREANLVWLRSRPSRFQFLHELGHAVDSHQYTGVERADIAQILGFRAGDTWAGDNDGDGEVEMAAPPAEMAADAYAACRMKLDPERGVWHRSYGYTPPTRWWHIQVCRVIARASED